MTSRRGFLKGLFAFTAAGAAGATAVKVRDDLVNAKPPEVTELTWIRPCKLCRGSAVPGKTEFWTCTICGHQTSEEWYEDNRWYWDAKAHAPDPVPELPPSPITGEKPRRKVSYSDPSRLKHELYEYDGRLAHGDLVELTEDGTVRQARGTPYGYVSKVEPTGHVWVTVHG